MDLIEGLDQCWRAVDSVVRSLHPDQLSLPTPCGDWNVHDLLAHLGGAESFFQGLPQPEPPDDWVNPYTGLDFVTGQGVAARRGWSIENITAEIAAASTAQLDMLRSLDSDGWQGETVGPMGPTTMAELARIRTFDVFTHLLDLRAAVDLPLNPTGEPLAAATAAGWVIERSGWGAVKQARLPDGSRVRLDLTGPGARRCDVVVDGKRGSVTEPSGEACENTIEGQAVAYLLLATGRTGPAEKLGLPSARGPLAESLLANYRLFG